MKSKHNKKNDSSLFIPFFIVFLIFSFSNVNGLSYDNYETIYNLSFSCTHDAYLENQHPANSQNCTPLYDDYTSDDAFITNTSKTDNTTITFTFNETKYSFKDLNIEMRHITGDYVFAPESIDIYFGNVKGIESYSYSGATCGSSSNLKYLEMYNTSYNSVDGFDTVKFVIEPHDCTGDKRFIFNEVNFKVSDSVNYLPTANFSFSNVCYNPSENSTIKINYSVADEENDIIYYATDYTKNKNFNSTFYYNKQLVGNLLDVPNYDFVTNKYGGSTCEINFDSNFNSSKFNLIEYVIDTNPLIDYSRYMLSLSSTCNGDSNFIYRLDNSLYHTFYASEFYGLNTEGEKLNITLYNSGFEKVTKIQYKVSQGNLTISYENSSGILKHLTNYSAPNSFEFSLNNYGNESSNTLLDFESGTVLTYDSIRQDSVKYIGVKIENGVTYQRYFTISGISPSLAFSTTPFKTDIEISSTGLHRFSYYLSDNINYPSKYRRYSYNLNVPLCENYINLSYLDDNTETNTWNPFNIITLTLGTSLTHFFNELGYLEMAQSVIWWIFIFMFFSTLIFQYFRSEQPNIIHSLILSSATGLFLSILISYGGGIIGFLIFFTIGVTSVLAPNLFNGGNNGR